MLAAKQGTSSFIYEKRDRSSRSYTPFGFGPEILLQLRRHTAVDVDGAGFVAQIHGC